MTPSKGLRENRSANTILLKQLSDSSVWRKKEIIFRCHQIKASVIGKMPHGAATYLEKTYTWISGAARHKEQCQRAAWAALAVTWHSEEWPEPAPSALGTQHKGKMQTVCTCKWLLPPRAMSKNILSYCHTQGSAFLGWNDWNCGNFISFRCHHPKMAQDWECSCSMNDKSFFTFNCKWSIANPR